MKDTPLPLYYKVYNKLRADLDSAKYSKGDKLPTEMEICDQFNVSRLTVRRALEELKREGLIERKKGKGTYFTGKKREEQLSNFSSFTNEAHREGDITCSNVLENKLVKVDNEFIRAFDLPEDARVVYLKRVRYLNDEPYAIENAYLNPGADIRVLNIIEKNMSEESLYNILMDEYGLNISYAEETLEVSLLSKEESELLGLKRGEPAVLRRRYTYLDNNHCIEFVKSIYRGDKYKFKVVRKI
ncbi:GntR family transcriptional regulator [Oceanotoga sp. DSM 15011]|jgi:GntR family transcriptional regulator|uniref:GntR family transcriptional regulator n=1 Tax=Oceanotoga teriensis TaxID=515440 RepID=A0AA45C4Z5_9BACT|nr:MULTISPECIES: GntR family transcriptional regulator [Oceanotoga]MDN5342869.1 GntR family transcriptional regulator, N-acetylglucosamine utilization regulator [Oceanotoga sp.]MDO7976601.1 GntR family transcriptional regulator [Oceanotoga teriensis]PWJ87686.1 GntR family transcriptional regulator [Oceanotoga teriensis]UYO99318.1 GntR family transcriptional regulator [Oceanotoga sp. DSM 15011]